MNTIGSYVTTLTLKVEAAGSRTVGNFIQDYILPQLKGPQSVLN
jgi:hypothetical protein